MQIESLDWEDNNSYILQYTVHDVENREWVGIAKICDQVHKIKSVSKTKSILAIYQYVDQCWCR